MAPFLERDGQLPDYRVVIFVRDGDRIAFEEFEYPPRGAQTVVARKYELGKEIGGGKRLVDDGGVIRKTPDLIWTDGWLEERVGSGEFTSVREKTKETIQHKTGLPVKDYFLDR